MNRTIDFILGVIALIVLVIPLVFVELAVWRSSKGPVLYWYDHMGQNNVIFKMPKNRSIGVVSPGFV